MLKLGVGCNADVTCLFVLFGRRVTTGAAAAAKAIATTTRTIVAAASGTAIAWTLSYFRQMPNVP